MFQEEFYNERRRDARYMWQRMFLLRLRKNIRRVAVDLRSIFYASSKKKAVKFYDKFRNDWQKEFPSAVKSLENSIDSCLTFFSFPEEEWISLQDYEEYRKIKQENLQEERTKTMKIIAGV